MKYRAFIPSPENIRDSYLELDRDYIDQVIQDHINNINLSGINYRDILIMKDMLLAGIILGYEEGKKLEIVEEEEEECIKVK